MDLVIYLDNLTDLITYIQEDSNSPVIYNQTGQFLAANVTGFYIANDEDGIERLCLSNVSGSTYLVKVGSGYVPNELFAGPIPPRKPM